MIKIINRYLFRQIGFTVFIVTLILTMVVWLTQSLRFIDLVVSRGFSLIIFFKMILFLLPDLVSIILPISMLISLIFVYNKLFIDNELAVMRAAGASNLSLSRSAFFLAFILMGFLYAINLYFLPLSFQKFRDIEHHIRTSLVSNLIKPGEFITFKGITVYTKERQRNGVLKGILVYDTRDEIKPYTVMAQQGQFIENSTGISVVMKKGNRQQIDHKTGKPNIITFDSYMVDLSLPSQQNLYRQKKAYERLTSDLFNPDLSKETPQMIKKFYAEAHQRLMMPLMILCFTSVTLSLFLSGDYNRRARSKKITFAVFICVILQIITLTLLNLFERYNFTILLGYFLIFCTLFFSLRLLQEKKIFFFWFKEKISK